MKLKKILSISGIITNSSTEVFVMSGLDDLKRELGTGFWKKWSKSFLYLETESDVTDFIQQRSGGRYNKNYRAYMSHPLLPRGFYDLYCKMCQQFPKDHDKVWELCGPVFMKHLVGSVLYYDYIRNDKILGTLQSKFPKFGRNYDDKLNYEWTVD